MGRSIREILLVGGLFRGGAARFIYLHRSPPPSHRFTHAASRASSHNAYCTLHGLPPLFRPSISRRISLDRQPLHRGPICTGLGALPSATHFHHVDLATGINVRTSGSRINRSVRGSAGVETDWSSGLSDISYHLVRCWKVIHSHRAKLACNRRKMTRFQAVTFYQKCGKGSPRTNLLVATMQRRINLEKGLPLQAAEK
jgi:hypothetical protein